MDSFWCHRFSRFEGFQEATDHAGGARIALGCYFTPQLQTIAAAGLPALQDIGGVRIKIAGILSSLPDIWSRFPLKPMSHRALMHRHPSGNLLGGEPLPTQLCDLLIAILSLGSLPGNGLLDVLSWRRTPLGNRKRRLHRLSRLTCLLILCLLQFGKNPCEQALDRLGQILPAMLAVCDPLSLAERLLWLRQQSLCRDRD